MIRFYVQGVGLFGPGLQGWVLSQPILSGAQEYVPALAVPPPCALLPANERRRAPQIVKYALAAGAEAFAAAGADPAATPSVFASSGADGDTIHEILSVLASPNAELSPTKFHNSVHNTAAGYWTIATGSQAAATSLCAHDDSFAAGLLEAAVQVAAGQSAIALIAYDVPYPEPLHAKRPLGPAFAVALLFSPNAMPASLARVELELCAGAVSPSRCALPAIEALRRATPAARSLPLLAALAGGAAGETVLSYLDDMGLMLRIDPCCPAAA